MNSKGISSLIIATIAIVVMIVVVVVGLFIVHTAESAIIDAGFNSSSTWWGPYQNFVSNTSTGFTLSGVAAIVFVLSFILAILLRLTGA